MPMDSTSGFDAYRLWLDIHTTVRPLNAYHLLDVIPFESNIRLIESSFEQKRAMLDSHREGAPPQIWQHVSDELEKAISTLLDPVKKTTYDDNLRREQGDLAPSLPEHKPIGAAPWTIPGKTPTASGGDSVSCPGCGVSVGASVKFCTQCGTNLWAPCCKCDTMCPAGETFCGSCGANLQQVLEEAAIRATEALREAQEYRKSFEFGPAVKLLTEVSRMSHPELAATVETANSTIRDIAAERDTHLLRSTDICADARQILCENEYEEAVAVLGDIPEPLRSEEAANMLVEANGCLEEMSELTRELRAAVKEKRTNDLPPIVERLLELKPDQPQTLSVATQLKSRFYKSSFAAIKRHEYSQAKELLDMIPTAVIDDRVTKLQRLADELSWLNFDVRGAPVADRQLLGIADRFCKLSPTDKKAAAIREQVAQRVRKFETNGRHSPIPWASPPKSTPLGPPVDWASEMQNIALSDKVDRARWAKHPGRYFVACGLALRGLGRARMMLNLVPEGRGGMREKAMKLLRKRPVQSAWGIDIGYSAVKAVKLAPGKDPLSAVVLAERIVEYGKPLSQTANDDESDSQIKEALRSLISMDDFAADRVCVGVSSRSTHHFVLELPNVAPDRIPNAIRYELPHRVHLPIGKLAWDHFVLRTPGENAAADAKWEVLLVVAKKDLMNRSLDIFDRVGLKVDHIQSDSLAAYNMLFHEQIAWNDPDEESGGAVAAVDVGDECTNIVIASPDCARFYNSGIGGRTFTRALVTGLSIGTSEAEEIKRNPTAAKCAMNKIDELWAPIYEELAKEIEKACSSFRGAAGSPPLRRIVGFGGGFQLHGLFRFLRLGK